MKYNRKAIIAAIVKIQKEKLEKEKKELEAKETVLADKARQAAASFILSLPPEDISNGLETTKFDIDITTNRDKTSLVYLRLHFRKTKKSKPLDELAKAYEEYCAVRERLYDIDYYLGDCYRNGGTNLSEKVKNEVPYDYELQADELIKNTEFVDDIETIRKQIFKD